MKNYRQSLPPLDLLVFFECAARNLSFSAAASELSVTQTAVSKRIQQLEAFLGVALFLRNGRMITLTPAGTDLSERVTILLEFAQSTLESVAVAEDRPLRIASNATIAAFWLPQRLKSFALSEQACAIELVSSDAKNLIDDTSLDLAIIHGEAPHDAHATKLLFTDRLVPVIAPDAAKKLGVGRGGSIFDISRSSRPPLMDYRQIRPHWSNWMTWLDPEERDDWDIETCTTYAQSIGRALEGKGFALASPDILADELSRGTLTPIGPTRTRDQLGYWIVKPAGRWPHPSVDELIQFLLK